MGACDPVATIVRAAWQLGHEHARLERALVGLVRLSMQFYDTDDSGVHDFHTKLRRMLADLPPDYPLRPHLVAAGMAFEVDAGDEGEDDGEGEAQEEDETPAARLLRNLPEFPPEEPPPPVLRLVPGSAQDVEYTRLATRAGAALLEVAPDDVPLEIVTRIEAFVIRARRLGRAITSAEAERLAVLWGDCVCRATDWSWQLLDVGEALETAIGSPDGRFAVDVVAMFYQQLRSVDVTLILLFNAIVVRKLPEPRSDGAIIVAVQRIVPRY